MRKFRSVTSASDANLYVGPFGEIVVDDAGQLRIQDNVTAGGHLVGSNTGNITFVDSIISTSDISGNIVIDSDRLTVTNAIAIGNLLISNNNIFASSNVLSVSAGHHSFVFRDVSEGFNQGTGAVLKFDNVENSNGPTFETWYGETGNPFDPPGQHSLDIRVASNAAIDYVEFASHNWDNYMGLDNQNVFIHTNWNTDPQQSWRFNADGELILPTQGIIRSFNNSSQLIVTDTSVKITSTDQNTTAAFNLLIQDSNFVFEGNVIPSGNVTYDLGTLENQWRSLYVSGNTIYIGGTPLSVNNGELTVNGNPVGSGLPTVTIPGELGTTYKGLQVSYGMVHSNGSQSELNVNKIVINQPAVTTADIDPTSSQDYFRVSGVGNSSVLSMFVFYGDANGPKSLETLKTFAKTAIDNVILDGGVEGQYNTVEQMKTAFYANYNTLASAADGLYTDFNFYQTTTPVNVGTTVTREGSGATFSVTVGVPGDPYAAASIFAFGTNYRAGHKVKLLGTDLGGTTPENDVIITVVSVDGNGAIVDVSFEGTSNAGAMPGAVYNDVAGTNYQVGSGFAVSSINFLNTGAFDYLSLISQGSNYVANDVVTLLGSGIETGSSPTNDITITITAVDGFGTATSWTATGVFPRLWPINSISDGGVDQYDTANFINSSFATEIAYNDGNTVADGAAAFGQGSSYSFVYNTAIFGLFVTGNGSTYIETSGNSGADGGSTTEAGNIYGPNTVSQTFDNAVSHINVIGDPYLGPIVSFVKTDGGSEVDTLIPDDGNGAGVGITRSNNNGIFNPYREEGWNSSVSPDGTLWNTDGWDDFSNVQSRIYQPLYAAFGSGGLGSKIVGTECVMYLPDNGKYYAIKFDSWTQGGNGGGFSYTRRELDLNNLSEGIRFPDGTRLKSAEGLGRVKLQSPGNRRIEEAYGYKQVSVTETVTTNLTTVTSRSAIDQYEIWIDTTNTTIDDIIDNPQNYGDAYGFELSLDNINWYPLNGWGNSGNERSLGVFPTLVTYNQGDTVYFRYKTGGGSVVWWDKNELPGGGANFRGAVIDYHAFTGESTIVGTIHIVDDDGEENITHTEVTSGSTDGENDDLWLVTTEGQIRYRRIDGEAKTLKVQWGAKVFYGSEIWD